MVFRPLIYIFETRKADFPTPNNDLEYENI